MNTRHVIMLHIQSTYVIFFLLSQKTYVACVIIPYFTVEETKVQLTCYHYQFQALTGFQEIISHILSMLPNVSLRTTLCTRH